MVANPPAWMLKLEKPGIPDYRELNERLMSATGWQVVAVPGLVPDDVFFDHLANRRRTAGMCVARSTKMSAPSAEKLWG